MIIRLSILGLLKFAHRNGSCEAYQHHVVEYLALLGVTWNPRTYRQWTDGDGLFLESLE